MKAIETQISELDLPELDGFFLTEILCRIRRIEHENFFIIEDYEDFVSGDGHFFRKVDHLSNVFHHLCVFIRFNTAGCVDSLFYLDHRALEMVAYCYRHGQILRVEKLANNNDHRFIFRHYDPAFPDRFAACITDQMIGDKG